MPRLVELEAEASALGAGGNGAFSGVWAGAVVGAPFLAGAAFPPSQPLQPQASQLPHSLHSSQQNRDSTSSTNGRRYNLWHFGLHGFSQQTGSHGLQLGFSQQAGAQGLQHGFSQQPHGFSQQLCSLQRSLQHNFSQQPGSQQAFSQHGFSQQAGAQASLATACLSPPNRAMPSTATNSAMQRTYVRFIRETSYLQVP